MAGSKEDAETVSAFFQGMLCRAVLMSGAVAAEITTPLVRWAKHVLRRIATPCAVFTLSDA
jgi:adenylate cyclase